MDRMLRGKCLELSYVVELTAAGACIATYVTLVKVVFFCFFWYAILAIASAGGEGEGVTFSSIQTFGHGPWE